MLTNQLKLCLVTHLQDCDFNQYKKFIQQAIEGGVTLLQLRDKSNSDAERYRHALELMALLKPYNIPLIINDHVDLAQAIEADGVHLGQGDGSPEQARKKLGPDKIIGWSVETLSELELANQSTDLNYIAASAVFPSKTKNDCRTIWGLKGLQELTQKSRHPVMAIGGIHAGNVHDVMASGACGVAVISAIHDHSDPKQAARDLITKISP